MQKVAIPVQINMEEMDRFAEALTAGDWQHTFIDTADSYGPGISETLIAKALHPYPAGLVVATKGGLVRPGADRWVTDCRPEHLRHACAAARQTGWEDVLPHRRMFPRRQALPHQTCSRCLTVLRPSRSSSSIS
jgi:aryl-alcohol dehydrogenase-like predicted oxidoreductase